MSRRNVWKGALVVVLAFDAAGIVFGDKYPGLRWVAYVTLALIAAGFLFVLLMDRHLNKGYERAAYAELDRMRGAERRS